jgi:hypothetical protein
MATTKDPGSRRLTAHDRNRSDCGGAPVGELNPKSRLEVAGIPGWRGMVCGRILPSMSLCNNKTVSNFRLFFPEA